MKTAAFLSLLISVTGTFGSPVAYPNPDSLDILVPGPNNTLVRPEHPALAVRDVYKKKSRSFGPLSKRACGISGSNVQYQVGDSGWYCANYCEASLQQVTGDAVVVSSDVDCTTSTCGEAHAYTETITTSWSINVGLDSKDGDDTFKAGASWTYSDAVGTTNTYTFTPSNGDKGHIIFKPYYQQSCGTLTTYDLYCNSDNTLCYCEDSVIQVDNNACAQTPMKLGSGEADGVYSFCHTDTGYGC